MRNIDPKLHERLAGLISSMGFEFVGGEMLPQGRQLVFRIYIDKENGVTIDECSLVSRQVSAMLDVEDLLPGARYYLEVSSPGIDRPLYNIEHFKKYIGSRAKIKLSVAINQRRQFTGKLLRIEGEDIHLLIEDLGQEVVLPFSDIEKANVIGEVKISSRNN